MPRHKKPTGDSDPISHDDERYFSELSEFFTPYSEDEIRLHTIDRALKIAVEERHARNYRLIEEAILWISFLYHNGPKPKVNIGEVITNEIAESKASNLDKPIKIFCKALKSYGPGMMPHIRVVTYCSRSTATLYQYLRDIYPTPELEQLINLEREFFLLLTNQATPNLERGEFNEHITHLYSQYLAFASAYGSQLSAFIVAKERDYKLHLTGSAGSLPATKDDVKSAAKLSETKIKQAIKQATNGDGDKGCHHPDKKKDVKIQELIKHLAKLGIVFSIHHACERVFGLKHRLEMPWIYDWCHRHESDVQHAVELLRAAENPT